MKVTAARAEGRRGMKAWTIGFGMGLSIGLTGCYLFGDDANLERPLTRGFALSWYVDPRDQVLLLKLSSNGGIGIVDATVVAAGWNDDFIIAMQHPDLADSIEARLFHRDTVSGDYKLLDPTDSVYLWEGDSLYQRDGSWYHISNGSAIPDSLHPYRGITNYFVIDLREFREGERDGYEVHQAVGDEAFHSLRSTLGVPEDLQFTFIDPTLR